MINIETITEIIYSLLKIKGEITIDQIKLRKIISDNFSHNYSVGSNLDLISQSCASQVDDGWQLLAGRIKSWIIKESTSYNIKTYLEKVSSILNKNIVEFMSVNHEKLQSMIVPDRDYRFDYFAINTLAKSYLIKIENNIVEPPQLMYLRTAIQLWYPDLEMIKKVYDDLTVLYPKYTHASPTLFNSCYKLPQLSSCFLMTIEDNMENIAKVWKDCAMISQKAGGIGIDASSIRHSSINKTGESGGIVPLLKVIDNILRYVDQAGKRKGSGTIYLPMWHKDIHEFIQLKRNDGDESSRARGLFYSVWVSDLFMKCVEKDEYWYTFCPNVIKKELGEIHLNELHSFEFEQVFKKCVEMELYSQKLKARELWKELFITQKETGMPFVMFKDSINRKNAQENIGVIKSSNLCTEIVEHTSKDEIASCNLASIILDSCIVKKPVCDTEFNPETARSLKISSEGFYQFENNRKSKYNNYEPVVFDFDLLEQITRQVTRNLNQVIDRNYYITNVPEIKYSNLKNRPIGIGVQGLADVFARLDLPFTSKEAFNLNIAIFETIYYAFVSESNEIAKEKYQKKCGDQIEIRNKIESLIKKGMGEKASKLEGKLIDILKWKGGYYETFPGSPASMGVLQFDMWFAEMNSSKKELEEKYFTRGYDWGKLKKSVKKYGMVNSLGIALMPTATTAQINSRNEAIEPFPEVISSRTVLSGQYMIVNKYCLADLKEIRMWNEQVINHIVLNKGSIQNLKLGICVDTPENQQRLEHIKSKYKTVYEIEQNKLVKMHCERSVFVDQCSSFNVHIAEPTYQQLTSLYFEQWKLGSKTGSYYVRSKPKTDPINVALSSLENTPQEEEICVMCSS